MEKIGNGHCKDADAFRSCYCLVLQEVKLRTISYTITNFAWPFVILFN